MEECKCKQCVVFDECKVLCKGKFTCRCFGTTRSEVLFQRILYQALNSSRPVRECYVADAELREFQQAVREETKAELALKLASREEAIRSVLQALFSMGHNDDCLFCGRKDWLVLRAAKQWGIDLKTDMGQ